MSINSQSLLGSRQTILPAGAVAGAAGSSSTSSTDNTIARFDGTTGQLIQNSTVVLTDNGDIQVPSTATLGIQTYNTADQVTNVERFEMLWSSNVGTLRTAAAGTGLARNLVVRTPNSVFTLRPAGSTSGTYQFDNLSTSTAGAIGYNFSGHGNTALSGSNAGISLALTYNQASGTAANTDLKISRIETATGGGSQLFLEFLGGAAGTTSRFTVAAATGLITHASPVLMATSVALTNGAAAAAGTLTNAPTAGNPTKWVPVNDNGTTRYIPMW